jgi:hypothetical protein
MTPPDFTRPYLGKPEFVRELLDEQGQHRGFLVAYPAHPTKRLDGTGSILPAPVMRFTLEGDRWRMRRAPVKDVIDYRYPELLEQVRAAVQGRTHITTAELRGNSNASGYFTRGIAGALRKLGWRRVRGWMFVAPTGK